VSNTTMAAMAAALVVASFPAPAHNGLSENQVRALIKKEVAKIPRVRGPAGPTGTPGQQGTTGPAGMDGFPSLSAHVFSDGTVDEARPGGITQENVRLEVREVPNDIGELERSTTYCFIDLPPVVGGQVTIDGHAGPGGLASPSLDLDTLDPVCPIRVFFNGRSQFAAQEAFFYILLY
jgi:hypothetical protein